MKAFLLAAGNGTRLRPLTNTVPKCLLPVQGVPLLQIWLENCKAGGIDEVLVNVHALPQAIRDFAARNPAGVTLRIAEERELLGSAGTLAENRSFVENEKEFFILYGDVLTNIDLAEMLAFHRRHNLPATLAVHQVPDPSQCGIVTTDKNEIIQQFVEKPAQSQCNWAFTGVMIAQPQMLDLVPPERPADIGFHLLPRLVGSMVAYKISEYLIDIGTLQAYAAAQISWPGLRQNLRRGA